MSEQITITHERADDMPVIVAFLLKMRVAELIDKHFPTNGNWTGLSLGQMLVVWLTFIISEGDHRLYHVEPWVAAHQHTLSRSLHQEVLPRDCTDDRLATGLDYLYVAENWVECEGELNQTLIRVYDLHPKTIRVDPTTVSAYVTPDGLFQLGHSKDHRPDLPQLKVALATLEGKGVIITFWDTEEGARDASGFATGELERFVTLFRSPPGREVYEVAFADMAGVVV